MAKVRISVEFLHKHTCKTYEVSRVPCVGELVYDAEGEASWEVARVYHALEVGEDGVEAIVRVKE